MTEGIDVLVIDTNRSAIAKAKMMNIPAVFGSAISPAVLDEVNFAGIGRMIALTSNDEVNSLSVLHYNDVFDRKELYQLRPKITGKQDDDKFSPKHLQGRYLFGEVYDFFTISRLYESGYTVKATKLSSKFNFETFNKYYGNAIIPLFVVTEEKNLMVITTEYEVKPKPGQTIVALLNNPDK